MPLMQAPAPFCPDNSDNREKTGAMTQVLPSTTAKKALFFKRFRKITTARRWKNNGGDNRTITGAYQGGNRGGTGLTGRCEN
jgi:hypothetical protein